MGGRAGDLGGGVHVVADDGRRCGGVAGLDECAKRDHLAGFVARLEVGDIVGLDAERRVSLRGDAVGPAKRAEVVDVERAEVDLERVPDVVKRDAHHLGLGAVHVEEHLRHAGAERGDGAGDALVLVCGAHECVGRCLERWETELVAVLNLEFEAANHAEAVHWRRTKNAGEAFLNGGKLSPQLRHDFVAGQSEFYTLGERFQRDEKARGVGLRAKGDEGKADDRDDVADARRLAHDLRHAVGDGPGALDGSAIGELDEGDEVALVLGRHKAGRHMAETNPGQRDQPTVEQQADAAMTQHAA